MSPTPLAALLAERIRAGGPISVAEYMATALSHPAHGYYITRDPLGAAGDFTTAPEISQMFGELIGLWCATVWRMMGAPSGVRLVELGPGRGTLMADLLRATAADPQFGQSVTLHLVETSPRLRQAQEAALAGQAVQWHDSLEQVPDDGPLLLVANEFFDALPIRQFERIAGVWRERLVDIEEDGALRFVLGPAVAPDLPAAMQAARDGAVAEICPIGQAIAAAIGTRLAARGGAALIVDYGPAESAAGDSLQAVRGHQPAPVLLDPGAADLTAHVDFQALAAATPVPAHGPVTQGAWLQDLGIGLRAAQLVQANPDKTEEIGAAFHRLIHPEEMGTLFKVLALAHPSLAVLPGFEGRS